MRGWSWLFWLLLLVIGVALLSGLLLGERGRDDPRRWAEAEAIRAQTEEQQRWMRVSEPVRVALLAVGGGGLIILGLYAAYRLVERRSRTVYPNRDGLLPAVVLKPGEVLVDAGALAGPLVVSPAGPEYRLPPEAIPQLQAGANQGAAMTRTMRAWATHGPARRESAPPALFPEPRPALPPVELLTGDEAHIYRLLEEGAE